jgi:hypothetical protein
VSKGGGRGGVEPALAGPGLNATGPEEVGEYDKNRGSTDGPGGDCCRGADSVYPGGTDHADEGGEFSETYSVEWDGYAGTFIGKGEEGV